MEMLNTLRETLNTVQEELTTGVEKLRQNVASNIIVQQRASSESINEILNTKAGNDLLERYQKYIEEIRSNGDEGARLANLCSTRMGRLQQLCQERSESVLKIDSFMRESSDFEKKIREINNQIVKLTRFCNQTEQAMTHLEALCEVAHTEDEVDLIRQQAKSAQTIVNIECDSPNMLTEIHRRPDDIKKEKQEEVMLEEFLSSDDIVNN